MTFIFIYLLHLLISSLYCFDPDVDICENPIIDSAVNADDGQTYIFKGNYFWQTQPLNARSGIIGYANSLNHNWHNLPHPIRAAFAIPDQFGQLMTVFIHEVKWYLYQKRIQLRSGLTTEWPHLSQQRITTAFASNYKSSLIFLLHDDRTRFTLIDFANISKPIYLKSGKTTVNENFIWFIENDLASDRVLTDLIYVNAIVNYPNLLLLIAKDYYCKVDLSRKKFEKECAKKPHQKTNTLLGCPLNLSKRPITDLPHPSLANSTLTTVLKTSKHNNNKLFTDLSLQTIQTTFSSNSSEMAVEEESSSSASLPLLWIFGAIAATFLLIIVISAVVFVIRRRKKSSSDSYETNNRSNSLGSGKGVEKTDSMSTMATIATINSNSGSVVQRSSSEPIISKSHQSSSNSSSKSHQNLSNTSSKSHQSLSKSSSKSSKT